MRREQDAEDWFERRRRGRRGMDARYKREDILAEGERVIGEQCHPVLRRRLTPFRIPIWDK